MIDLVKPGAGTVRFFWTTDDGPDSPVGVHTFGKGGAYMIRSESLDRASARARWGQMLRTGWRKLN